MQDGIVVMIIPGVERPGEAGIRLNKSEILISDAQNLMKIEQEEFPLCCFEFRHSKLLPGQSLAICSVNGAPFRFIEGREAFR
jgi:hypothetical protein